MVKCAKCKKEVDYGILDVLKINLVSDYTYRYLKLFLCQECYDKLDIWSLKPESKILEILIKLFKNQEKIDNSEIIK